MKMNKKELAIISALRQDSRLSLTKMSKQTKIPVSTLHDKIREYTGDLIRKHTAIVDFAKLGYNTRALVFLKVEREQRQQLQDFLQLNRNVNNLSKVNNGYDFLIEFVFEHIKDMEDLIETIESKFKINTKETYYIIDEIKRESFLSSAKAVEMFADS